MTDTLSFEAAKAIYNSSNNKEVLEALETVFPKLRESEDEKVRKELIMFIKKRDRSGCDYDYDKWLTWLEKQGEKKDNNKLIWKHWSTGIAGNGEGKPIYLIKHYNTYSISSCLSSECDYILLSDLDKLISDEDNKKITDKNEPKFKVGDWVVNSYGDIWYIDSLDKKNYRVSNKGKYNYFPITKQDEMYLWTIQDAKPGDLLFISTKQRNYWAMFKEYDNNLIFFYCYSCGKFNVGGYVPIDSINKINPLPYSPHSGRFYNTMKKAGYKWDDEKKDLKKIEDSVEKAIRKAGYEWSEDTHQLKKIEQKHTWSEEDDNMIDTTESWLDTLCEYLKDSSPEYIPNVEFCINWLKSLKPQNRWKPSKGQLECLGYAIDKAEKDYSPLTNNRIYLTLKVLKEELEKLTE